MIDIDPTTSSSLRAMITSWSRWAFRLVTHFNLNEAVLAPKGLALYNKSIDCPMTITLTGLMMSLLLSSESSLPPTPLWSYIATLWSAQVIWQIVNKWGFTPAPPTIVGQPAEERFAKKEKKNYCEAVCFLYSYHGNLWPGRAEKPFCPIASSSWSAENRLGSGRSKCTCINTPTCNGAQLARDVLMVCLPWGFFFFISALSDIQVGLSP